MFSNLIYLPEDALNKRGKKSYLFCARRTILEAIRYTIEKRTGIDSGNVSSAVNWQFLTAGKPTVLKSIYQHFTTQQISVSITLQYLGLLQEDLLTF